MLETLEMCNKRLVPSMFYSHLHCPLKLRFLECPPDLTGNKEYVDEADVFFSNPLHWLQTSFPSQSTLPSHIVLFDALEKVEECSQITSLNVYNHWPKPRWYLPAKVATAEFKNHYYAFIYRVCFFLFQEISSFLEENRFAKQAEIFHTHFPEGRVGRNILIYTRGSALKTNSSLFF